MKHIIIQIESVMRYPPTLSLLKILSSIGHEVLLCTSEISEEVTEWCKKENINLRDIGCSYSPKNSAVQKMIKIPKINKRLKKLLDSEYDRDSLIWVMTSISLKYIGNTLYNRNYIMYMYELSQEIRYYPKFRYPRVDLDKLFGNAKAVIECEYNRAHIAKAWFGLEKLPYVVPNKPYMDRLPARMEITDPLCAKIMNEIKDKTIIIYQGIIDPERPLEPFIEAVDSLGENYALVIMSGDSERLKGKTKSNTYLLPFVSPPHHLEITSWANIGILTYTPVRGETTSPLNAVYCAPNKIFEYAMFGIPMIGNDIPGLTTEFARSSIGVSFKRFDKDDIITAIETIMENYDSLKKYSFEYYSKTDNKETFLKILDEMEKI